MNIFKLILASVGAAVFVTASYADQVGFRRICCDKTTESGADELYFLVAGKRSDNTTFGGRYPTGHFDINDGNQGDKGCGGYSGDAHCVMGCTMLDFALQEGQSADITVMVMEEDGGTTRPWQEIIAIGLQNSGDGRAAAAGEILGIVTELGLWVSDSDDFIGSFGITVTKTNGQLNVTWRNGDRVNLSIADPDDRNNPKAHEFRMNGDGSNYVGSYWLR